MRKLTDYLGIKFKYGRKFFVAKVQYDLPDENSGKIKKIREEKLVKGYSVTDVEAKVTEKVSRVYSRMENHFSF